MSQANTRTTPPPKFGLNVVRAVRYGFSARPRSFGEQPMSNKTEFTFRLEMKHNQTTRTVDADSFFNDTQNGWLIFHRKGQEYWRVRLDSLVSMETVRLESGHAGEVRCGE